MYSTVGGIGTVSNCRDPAVYTLVDIFRSKYDEAGYLYVIYTSMTKKHGGM